MITVEAPEKSNFGFTLGMILLAAGTVLVAGSAVSAIRKRNK